MPKENKVTHSFHLVCDYHGDMEDYLEDRNGWKVTVATHNGRIDLPAAYVDKLFRDMLSESNVDNGGTTADATLVWIAEYYRLVGEIVVLIQREKPTKKSKKR
jgi:hypothetical protein